MQLDTQPPDVSPAKLAVTFLRLGATAFGGPAAHIAMMRSELVERRAWLTEAEYLDLVGASNLIPGPSSTEVAIHVGRLRGGGLGLLIAGVCFILPAALIVTAIAWAYQRYGHLPQAAAIFYGIKPVIIAVVAQAIYSLGKTALKGRLHAAVAVSAVALAFAGLGAVPILFGSGFLMAGVGWLEDREHRSWKPMAVLIAVSAFLIGLPFVIGLIQPASNGRPDLFPLFAAFLKIGSVLYGSGYVLLAFLKGYLVDRLHWLTLNQVLDATAVGQFTPGPVFTTATFIGYLLAGLWGALAATFGIFLPAFVLVALSGPLVPRLRGNATVAGFLDGVNCASVALMTAVGYALARAALVDVATAGIMLVAGVMLFRYKVNSAWLVLGGAIVGFALSRVA